MINWIKRVIRGKSRPTWDVNTPEKLGEQVKARNTGGVFTFFGNISSESYKTFAEFGRTYTDHDVLFGHTEVFRPLEAFGVPRPRDGKDFYCVLINKIPPHVYIYEEKELDYDLVRKHLNFNMRKNWEQIEWKVSNRIDRDQEDVIILFHNKNDTRRLMD